MDRVEQYRKMHTEPHTTWQKHLEYQQKAQAVFAYRQEHKCGLPEAVKALKDYAMANGVVW